MLALCCASPAALLVRFLLPLTLSLSGRVVGVRGGNITRSGERKIPPQSDAHSDQLKYPDSEKNHKVKCLAIPIQECLLKNNPYYEIGRFALLHVERVVTLTEKFLEAKHE